ncbi:flagellar motor protein MotB [Limnohabitans radicicola]|uniref:OmpA family protein n=1 Tax=Limnohabitans radicicola TaxID=2771427 RepID=A0A927FE53_9BURK|nr:flagellar motor protein MotB [Limnohabitans radicicola]MBD8048932.1 OmpA family protein [Limnohabitans radicicola]
MAEADKPAEGTPDAAPAEPVRPIIRKIIVEDGHAGAHGGAWKIALADMMTAMMAFFLLMWLLGASTDDKRKSVAEYFRPASHSQIVFGELAGSNGMFGGKSIIDPEDGFPFTAKQTALLERLTPQSEGGPNADNGSSQEERNREGPQDDAPSGAAGSSSKQQDKENYDKLEKDIKQKLQDNKQLQGMKDQVNIVREKDGLRIEVIDKADYSMFSSGTADMNGKAANLIKEVAKSLKDMPNKVAIRGHTDSMGFAPDSLRNNWSLSSERADATRQILQGAGINSNRFSRIEGVADTAPFVSNNPADPRNRRVSITVLNQ